MTTIYLTADQLADFQAKLGIGDDEAIFTDARLDRLYFIANLNFNQAVADAILELCMDAAKLNDYTAGQTKENKSQIFENLMKMRDAWLELARRTAQVRIVGVRPAPPREVAKPDFIPINDKYPYGIVLGPQEDQFDNDVTLG